MRRGIDEADSAGAEERWYRLAFTGQVFTIF